MSTTMNTPSNEKHAGFISGAVVMNIVLGVLVLVFGSIMIWALVNYNDSKNNLDIKNQQAAQIARDDQKTKDQAAFDEKEKDPLKEFIGPDDLGRVNFKYPKTWSLYEASSGGGGSAYEAYFHPEKVPGVNAQNKYALRVYIVNQAYEQVLAQYAPLVKTGAVRSSAITTSGFNGTRFDGKFSPLLQGSVVVFKIRDKSLIVRTDSPSFQSDFDDKIIKTLTFKQ